jgi:hypothetical protein
MLVSKRHRFHARRIKNSKSGFNISASNNKSYEGLPALERHHVQSGSRRNI